ncbi:MAG: cytochrome [Marmoricola sp.]|nr:cytochrome [Marmoricola sp.]
MAALLTSPRTRLHERFSSVLLLPAPRRLDEAWLRFSRHWPAKPLAEPPAGSDLLAVPGDRGLPLIGHMLDSIRFGLDMALERYQRYGPVSWMGFFGTRMVVVAGPPATQAVLINKDKAFSQDGWTLIIDRFFHRGLMLMSFDEHHMHRRIMQEAFTRPRLTQYVDQVVPTAHKGVVGWPTNGPVRIYPRLKELTLDVATEVFMGGRGGEDTRAVNQAFVATVRAPTAIIRASLPGGRWRAGLQGRKLLEDYFHKHLPETRAQDGNDLFAALCHATTEDGDSFSDDDVVNHMIFLMMAAHDTTTATTTAAVYYLAKHPEWQERARAESDALGDSDPGIDGLEGLETLDLVVKETLRLVAPVPAMMRKAVKDTELEGHFIPAGAIISITPALNHYDPAYWTEPETFDPDRFGPERHEEKSHRNAWIPFGGGAHKCIGMLFGTLEAKAILHEMLRTYRWTVPEGYEVQWDSTALPVPVDGLPIQLHRR